jgi:LPXTG-motif cell wall-anchored protein
MDTSVYADVNKKYEKTVVTRQDSVTTDEMVEGTVGANGVIIFDGLGEGTFTITETVTPAGYNTIAPFNVVIEWDAPEQGSKDCNWTVKVADEEIEMNEDGVFAFEVVNHSGIELPETGGIGTTIFYIVGAALVIGAVVILVTRKRMSKN